MDTKVFEEYQKQFYDWQKKFFDTWLENLPNGKNSLNFTENFEKVLQFQEEAVKTYIDAQEKTTEMILKSQKQFWADYFEAMKKTPVVNIN
ncbi:MAG: thylakoid-associated protein [Hydrococcus sp. Prado102]|jgi:hypothetical protein|nr:thylakoid-associated protein [Hydrococcus sp. Prado102]